MMTKMKERTYDLAGEGHEVVAVEIQLLQRGKGSPEEGEPLQHVALHLEPLQVAQQQKRHRNVGQQVERQIDRRGDVLKIRELL
jgi:hypothetical protein